MWAPPFEFDSRYLFSYEAAISRIEESLRLGIDPSLDAIEALCRELGHPERCFRSVQIAGTNGKTSTSRYTSALLEACGHRCALYTSPHLVRYNERFEVSGTCIEDDELAYALSLALYAWQRICERDDTCAQYGVTEFELLTAAAFIAFARADVEVAVFEVGLGGTWDATCASHPQIVAITGIGLDHMQLLGTTLAQIASEKAGVIDIGRTCVLGASALDDKDVRDVLLNRCKSADVIPTLVCSDVGDWMDEYPCTCFRVTSTTEGANPSVIFDIDVNVRCMHDDARTNIHATYSALRVLGPTYQPQNIACALALATAYEGMPLQADLVMSAIMNCIVPGRFDVIRQSPLLMVDACHNPQSVQAFVDALKTSMPQASDRPNLLLGVLSDKDYRGIIQAIVPMFEHIYVTQSESARALPAHELAQIIQQTTGRHVEGVYPNTRQALLALGDSPLICCGTITLIGEVCASVR